MKRGTPVTTSKIRSRLLALCLSLAAAGLAAWGVQTAARPRRSAQPVSMAALLPPGALLTIESPDFGQLLRDWNASPEQRAWLTSDNHSVFANSRLFGRLDDARTAFEGAASSPTRDQTPRFDADFLTSIAGQHSIFAWYDIGNLEFVYITHLGRSQAGRILLLQSRAAFTPRRIGQQTFFMRRGAGSEQGGARTVAFAEVSYPGDTLLVLATREDLIAGTLRLLTQPGSSVKSSSLAAEPWYTDASAALGMAPTKPALRMVLNLDRIVATPYFRSYWIQRNISEMKLYRAAVADLYREPGQFREERALLLKSPETLAGTPTNQIPLETLAALAPHTGVVRAMRTDDPGAAVAALDDRLLNQVPAVEAASVAAPDLSLTPAEAGSSADLEISIDTPAPVALSAHTTSALTRVFASTGLNAVMTYSSASEPETSGGLWIPIHSAVVLRSAFAWNPERLEAALQRSLQGTLTTSTLGIEFRSEAFEGHTLYTLTGAKPLLFALTSSPALGQLCLLSDDRGLLLQLLKEPGPSNSSPSSVVALADFDHTSERAPYARLTGLLDGGQKQLQGAEAPPGDTPRFFSGNIRSLSDSFSSLAGVHVSEQRDGATVRQTVLYRWQVTGERSFTPGSPAAR